MKKRLLLLAFFLLSLNFIQAQIVIESELTIEEYVNDVLLGTGVTAFNVTYTGSDVQLGHMTGGEGTIFPIDEGLILSTAVATNSAAEDCLLGGFDDVPFEESVSGDPDLLSISQSVPGLLGLNCETPNSMNDLCILEFDFVATGDTVKFNYSFGSDEYSTYICQQYNDIFAFFLSGPGITGPYDSPAGFPGGAVNIAAIPDTDPAIPITITSVNNGTNEEYYIDNEANPVDFCMNGFTIPLEARYPVTCGETYHIKLAIGDGADTALESVVVLEAGSFTSNSVVEVDLSIDVGLPDANLIYEDCGLATLTFTRPIETILDIEEMVIIQYGGTAENGVDFSLLPDTIIFPPGVEQVQFEVDAFIDNITEGSENVQMEILNLAACNGGGITSFFEFTIDDVPEALEVNGYTVNICSGADVDIAPEVSGGYGNYTYLWDTNETTEMINVAPDVTTTYNVVVSDTCGMPSAAADIEVNVLEVPSIEVTIDGGDLLLDCFSATFITGQATGGDGNFTYEWLDQNGNNLFGFENTLNYWSGQGASTITLQATDGCGFIGEATINVNLNVPPIDIDLPATLSVDCNEPFQLVPGITGGQPPYFNQVWLNEADEFIAFTGTLDYSTGLTQTLEFQVTDECGQTQIANVEIDVNAPPVEIAVPQELVGTCLDQFDVEVEVLSGLPGYTYEWTLDGAVVSIDPNVSVNTFDSAELTILVTDACSSTGEATTLLTIANPAVVVDLGDDIDAYCLDQTEIIPVNLEGLGNLSYDWTDSDSNLGGEQSIIYQSYEGETISLSVTDECGTVGSDQLNYNILPSPISLTLSPDTLICAGQDAVLVAEATGGEGDLTIEWQSLNEFGSSVTVAPEFSSNYPVNVSDACGNQAGGSTLVEVQDAFAIFEVDFISDTEVQFFASEESQCDGCSIEWNFGDGNTSTEPNPLHVFDGLFEYDTWMIVTSELGCVDSVFTTIPAPVILYVPNSFTPNNDGINDVFAVKGAQIESFEMQIFNRWGDVVYYSTDLNDVWDGSDNGGEYYSKNEVYNYIIKVKAFDTEAYEYKGFITLIR